MSLNVESTEAMKAIYQEYIEAEAHIVEPPQDCTWGMREMLVQDLDGNRFRIGCPIDAE